MTADIIAVNLPVFQQRGSGFENPDRKILHGFLYAGDSFGLNKAELFVML